MSGGLIFLLLTSLIALSLAFIICVAHNVKWQIKSSFAAICIALVFWQVSIYISDQVTSHLYFWNSIVFVGPTLALFSSLLFIDLISSETSVVSSARIRHKPNAWVLPIAVVAAGAQLLVAMTGRIFSRITYNSQHTTYSYDRSALYFVYILGIVMLMAMVIVQLAFSLKSSKPQSHQRQAARTVLFSFVAAIVLGATTNIAIPVFTKSESNISFGLLSVDVFAVGLAWSVIRYRFLDIRGSVFRAAGYAMSLSLIVVFYVTATSLLTEHLTDLKFNATAFELLSAVTLVAVVSFQPLRQYFNKVTNRYFYRDAYDPQELIDQLNRVLVANIDLENLLETSAAVIAGNLKSDYCVFCIGDTNSDGVRVIGNTNRFSSAGARLATLLEELHVSGSVVIATDDLSVEQGVLKEALAKSDIAVVARLVSSSSGHGESPGYLFMGRKRSGNRYTRRDLQILETISRELVIAIQNALRFEEIQQFNVTLQQKVDEATRKLRNTNDKLRTLDQTKDDFISMASHQLRTPLTSVKGYVSMVLDGDAGPINPMQRKLLDQSFTSAQRMVYLIADLLNISRLKTGRFVIETSPTNLAQTTKDEISQLVETAKGRGLELTYDKPHDFPTYMLDTVKIRQVIMNFVDNAIYYTPSGGHIHVELSDKPKSIELRVIDDGIGVPRNIQHHLFTKFYRAPNAQKARPDGTGLGLFMAKKVVLAQGGAIIYESTEGKGSVFGFSFAKSHLAVPPAKPAKLH